MKKSIFLPLLFCLIISVCGTDYSQASDDNTIIWLHSQYPPYYITTGPDTGNGIADRVEKLLRKKLTGYKHVRKEANWKRVMQLMRAGENVINLTLLKTPDREKFIEYSVLTSVKPTNGICVRSDAIQFEGVEEVSFYNLLNYSYSGAPKTTWGKKVIAEINKIYNKHNILQQTSIDLEPFLDETTLLWFKKEAKKLYSGN